MASARFRGIIADFDGSGRRGTPAVLTGARDLWPAHRLTLMRARTFKSLLQRVVNALTGQADDSFLLRDFFDENLSINGGARRRGLGSCWMKLFLRSTNVFALALRWLAAILFQVNLAPTVRAARTIFQPRKDLFHIAIIGST